jgi:two-component sensor histidine kinase
MQSRRLKDDESKAAMKESRLRIQAMSLIHQRLYQMENLSTVNFKYYIDDLTGMLIQAYGYRPGEVELRLNIEKEFMDVDTAMPLALLVNEILTNSFKYAFQEVSRPMLAVRLEESDSSLRLSISDNGPGLGSDPTQDGFGRKLIAVLARQLKAGYSEDRQGGSTYLFIIPLQKNSR